MKHAGRVALVLCAALLVLAGCADDGPEFPVSPSLNPRASRIFLVRVPGEGLLAGRECAVYVPPGYPAPRKRYPVLYVQDGGDAFDRGRDHGEWFGFDSAADAMIARGEIAPLIIVAIPSNGHRFRDYIPEFTVDHPFPDPPTIAPDTTRYGGAYVRAVRTELKPLIDRAFATNPRPDATGITGFSLGGLISVYALYQESTTFGIAGGFSGSYRWFSWPFLGWIEWKGRPVPASLWIDTGLIDDNTDDARELDAIARAQGFLPGEDYEYREIADGDHSTLSVRRRVPAFLAFFSRRAEAARIATVEHTGD